MESKENKIIRCGILSFGSRYFNLTDIYNLCDILSQKYNVRLKRERINQIVDDLSETGWLLSEEISDGIWAFRISTEMYLYTSQLTTTKR